MNKTTKIFVGVLVLVGLALLAWAGASLAYKNKLFPNSQVAGVKTSGLTRAEAKTKIVKALEEYQQKEIWFKFKDKAFSYPLNFNQISFDIEAGIDQALANQSLAGVFTGQQQITLPVRIEEPLRNKLLEVMAQEVAEEKKEEAVFFDQGQLTYQQARPGISLDREESLKQILAGLGELKEIIPLAYQEEWPSRRYLNLLPTYYRLSELINNTPIKIMGNNTFLDQVEEEQLISWIEIDSSPLLDCRIKKGCLLISNLAPGTNQVEFNQEKVGEYINQLTSQLDRSAKNAELAFSNGRVVVATPSRSGFQIDRENLVEKIAELVNQPRPIINTKVKQQLPAVHEGNIKKLGIKKLIGKGESTFYGSSGNRVHNVRTGAQKINGSLVAPGDTFSTGDTLGSINRSTGYLQELVIKGNKTVPEYGGGLCQIATTMFRATLQSGMEIVERHNHAYRVGYYEPPIGMDATIYIPSPDLKFRNNTDKWILIQYTMSSYYLSFDFYGTDDGREIYISQPRVSNIKPPPPPQEIKDPSLKPGQRIKEEGAHPGADASFTYRVTRDGETLINQKITSHYQAWSAKYRVGPKKKDKKTKKRKN